MATRTANIPQVIHRQITIPHIYFEIRRKDLWISTIILLAGLAIPILMALSILSPSLGLLFLGFGLAAIGGVLLLIRLGEIA